MRKLVLLIATSLDGYIAGPSEEIDWLFSDQDYGYAKFFASIDTVIMGRKTYELALSFDADPYPGTRAFVFTRAPHRADPHAAFIAGDIAHFISKLKQDAGKNIWLIGGAEIVAECLRQALIDEFVISIHPIVLGAGIALFRATLPKTKLQLVGSESFASGLVQLTYVTAR